MLIPVKRTTSVVFVSFCSRLKAPFPVVTTTRWSGPPTRSHWCTSRPDVPSCWKCLICLFVFGSPVCFHGHPIHAEHISLSASTSAVIHALTRFKNCKLGSGDRLKVDRGRTLGKVGACLYFLKLKPSGVKKWKERRNRCVSAPSGCTNFHRLPSHQTLTFRCF